jgi:hypothetical protein
LTFDPRQREIGWVCPECHLARGKDRCDPCIGKLPGVLFACCGHGGKTPGNCPDGYILFENGVAVRFTRLTQVTRDSAEELAEAIELKERLGQ